MSEEEPENPGKQAPAEESQALPICVDRTEEVINVKCSSSERSFHIESFSLQSASPVFREMLFSRDPHDNNVLLLEQFPSDVGMLLDIIADNPETITNPNLTITQCLRLYQMADEYELHSALRQQTYLLISRHIIENPFEALAVACKREKLDMELACLAIKSFHLVPPSGLSKASRHVYKQTQYATSWIDLMNPANWTVHYIERCGPLAFSSYIGAYLENCCTPKGVVQQAASEEQRAKLMAKVAITFKSRYLERLPRIF